MSKEANIDLLYDRKNHSITPNRILEIKDYQHLGYTSKSIIKILQTALLAEIESPKWTEHDKWDIYNLLTLLKRLIPEAEFQFLDEVQKKK